jgi:RNA polymerase sigma factor (sigma-70 family)
MADDDAGAVNAGLAALLDAERSALKRFLSARCGDPSEADDLLQELWLKLANAPTGPVANGRAYLFRMANNLVLDRARMRRRSMTRDRAWLDHDEVGNAAVELRPDRAPSAEAGLIEAEEAEMIRQAVEALPPGARRALLLYRFEGYGQAEIARIMGISQSGVEKHLSLAMKHLRANLRDCGFFGTATSLEQEAAGDEAPNRNFEP